MTARRAWLVTLAVVGAVTLLRLAALILSPLEFYPDEAQYWFWSTTPDVGYFSKPPLIAWLIGASRLVCGDGEWCVRLSSPLLHGGTALILFGIGRLAYGARAGLFSALGYLSLPGVSYSSGIISTDVPLLFFTALALFAFLKTWEAKEAGRVPLRWAALCGAAVGLGMLAKYAMLYFVAGLVLAAILDAGARRTVLSRSGAVIAVIALAVFSPNIVWNARHQFATVGHTAANANWSWNNAFNPGHLADFVLSQFGVFGPILFAAYLYAVWRVAARRDRSSAGRVFTAFSIVPLVLVTIQSFLSEANANWAAAAFVAATPLAAETLITRWPRPVATLSYGGTAAAALVMMALLVSPAVVEGLGLANAYKRLNGWAELGRTAAVEAQAGGFEAIVAQNRSVTAELLYYARPAPVLIWDQDPDPRNHFDIAIPLTPDRRSRVLLVLTDPPSDKVLASFERARLIRDVRQNLGGGIVRTTHLYEAVGYRGR